ncbi:MAG: hypothetical protein VKI39_05410 [Synechococcus sp.]|nr:hypothetical protein [Synechococcus sp.]
MKSSFLALPPQLADPRVRRWAPALLAALALQLPILLLLHASWPEPRRPSRTARLDDTPSLLRWSRTAPPAKPAASLNTIPLPGLLDLPPPPPPVTAVDGPLPPSALAPSPPSRRAAVPADPPSPLPRQPGEAFLLAKQVAAGSQPADPSTTLVAVQRRQWWPLPGQEQALLAIWAAAREQPLPAGLGALPPGIEIRTVAPAAAEPLGLGDLHGRSIRHGNELWLLWRQGAMLWILRGGQGP